MPTLNCIINAALQQQHRSLPLTLYYTVNAVLRKWSNASLNFIQGLQSYIIKFCPTSNSILSGSPRHEFETLRLKRCRTSEAVIQKCCWKTLFWETSKNLHFSGKLHEILKKAYVMKFSLSDTSSLLACICYIIDSIVGAFLSICEIIRTSYPIF